MNKVIILENAIVSMVYNGSKHCLKITISLLELSSINRITIGHIIIFIIRITIEHIIILITRITIEHIITFITLITFEHIITFITRITIEHIITFITSRLQALPQKLQTKVIKRTTLQRSRHCIREQRTGEEGGGRGEGRGASGRETGEE